MPPPPTAHTAAPAPPDADAACAPEPWRRARDVHDRLAGRDCLGRLYGPPQPPTTAARGHDPRRARLRARLDPAPRAPAVGRPRHEWVSERALRASPHAPLGPRRPRGEP